MATFVLVSGGYIYRDGTGNRLDGAWIWREVQRELCGLGHDVFAPTLTGIGEKAHLVSPEIDITTHINDVLGTIYCEELRDVILVGWSIAGITITGVAGTAPERLRHLVYADALAPHDGERFADIIPKTAAAFEEGGMDARWLHQPAFGNEQAAAIGRTYLRCVEPYPDEAVATALEQSAYRARAEGWRFREIESTHSDFLGPRFLLRTRYQPNQRYPNALQDAVNLLDEVTRIK